MKRPNIIVILIDDLGWADLGCYGSSFYETPRLDALAAQGLRFTDAYAASPVCSPTRASLLTGQYPARIPITNFIAGMAAGRLEPPTFLHHLPTDLPTMPGLLRAAGYATWHVGKWHLGDPDHGHGPTDIGFDLNIGGCKWGMPFNGYTAPYDMPACANLPDGPDGEYLTDRITDEAIRLLREHDGDKPFFLHLAHYAVHTPIEAPADLVEKYRRKAADLGLDPADAIVTGEPFATLHKRGQHIERRVVQSDPTYAAMVENLDTNIGRLLDALADTGLADDTLVIFTSDNGGLATSEGSPTCNAPLSEGKGWTRDGGIREPMIIRWPGQVPANTTTATPITTPDLLPTLLDIADTQPPDDPRLDGVSLAGLLRDPSSTDLADRPIYWHYPHYSNQGDRPSSAIRVGRWKLIEHHETGALQLFDLDADVGETENLADRESDRAAEMRQQLADWRDRIDATMPTPNPNWTDDWIASTGDA